MRILWLFGPPGSGKSTVGWRLYEQLGAQGMPAGYVDIDQLGMCYPARTEDPDRHELKAEALAAVAANYDAVGCTVLVVSGILAPGLAPLYERLLGPYLPAFCHLSVDAVTLRARVTGRGDPEAEWESTLNYAQQLEACGLGTRIEASSGTPEELTQQILDVVGPMWPDHGGLESYRALLAQPRVEPSDASGDVLVLRGPAGTGKSSVGWSLYTHFWDITTAGYLDLEQLGFSTVAGAKAVLQANNASAVWSVFGRAGATQLLVAGRLVDTHAVKALGQALQNAHVTQVRLHASHSALVERITARSLGVRPAHLAGDELLGLTADEVARHAEAAHHQGRMQAEHGESELVVDTTTLAPADVATRILAALEEESKE